MNSLLSLAILFKEQPTIVFQQYIQIDTQFAPLLMQSNNLLVFTIIDIFHLMPECVLVNNARNNIS